MNMKIKKVLLPVKSAMLCLLLVLGSTMASSTDSGSTDSAINCFGSVPFNCVPETDIAATVDRSSHSDMTLAYANFAWSTYYSYLFPADTTDPTKPSMENGFSKDEYTAVFESYISATDLFPDDGSHPRSWNAGHAVPEVCGSGGIYQVLDEYIQAGRMGPVVDVDGSYLRYGIGFNKAMYDYVVNNTLYNIEGQEAFDATGKKIEWPRENKQGKNAVFIKSAWKIITGDDNASEFYTTMAYIYNKAGGRFGQEHTVEESCSLEKVGLVGLHITQRTETSPQWVWATFEHIANAPWLYDFKSKDRQHMDGRRYSLFNLTDCPRTTEGTPGCDEYNVPPGHPWDPKTTGKTTQVIRQSIPNEETEISNVIAKQNIAPTGSLWARMYYLAGVQFPTVVDWETSAKLKANVNPAYPRGLPTPSILANSTMETYIQGDLSLDPNRSKTSNGDTIPQADQHIYSIKDSGSGPSYVYPWGTDISGASGGVARNTSSCKACHGDATMATGTTGNFVFSLGRAKSSVSTDELNILDLSTDLLSDDDTLIESLQNIAEDFSDGNGIMQRDDGVLNYSADDEIFDMVPIKLSQAAEGFEPGLTYTDDGQVKITTDNGREIISNPIFRDVGDLDDVFTDLNLDIKVNENGNIDVEVLAGSKFKYNGRPALSSTPANDNANPGLSKMPSQLLDNLVVYIHVFEEGNELKQQAINSSPANWDNLKGQLEQISNVESVVLNTDGVVEVTLDGVLHRGVMSYKVQTGGEPQEETIFVRVPDQNRDGVSDFEVTYPNGDSQYLYYVRPQEG